LSPLEIYRMQVKGMFYIQNFILCGHQLSRVLGAVGSSSSEYNVVVEIDFEWSSFSAKLTEDYSVLSCYNIYRWVDWELRDGRNFLKLKTVDYHIHNDPKTGGGGQVLRTCNTFRKQTEPSCQGLNRDFCNSELKPHVLRSCLHQLCQQFPIIPRSLAESEKLVRSPSWNSRTEMWDWDSQFLSDLTGLPKNVTQSCVDQCKGVINKAAAATLQPGQVQ